MHGFVATALQAWSNHYALEIKPDHLWIMILQGISKHVNANHEQLRSKFVSHDATKALIIRRDDFRDAPECCFENDWRSCVAEWTESLKQNIEPGLAQLISNDEKPFSTTTIEEYLASCAVVMDTCQKYFTYSCITECGFPAIILHGRHADWIKLRTTALQLIAKACDAEFGRRWTDALDSVLQRIIDTIALQEAASPPSIFDGAALFRRARGTWLGRLVEQALPGPGPPPPPQLRTAADAELFWNSMLKRGATVGSGACTFYAGWINALLPYTASRDPNPYCSPYSPAADYAQHAGPSFRGVVRARAPFCGLPWEDFPSGLCAVPVRWELPSGRTRRLTLRAGFVGGRAAPPRPAAGGAIGLAPVVSWYITDADEQDGGGGGSKSATASDAPMTAGGSCDMEEERSDKTEQRDD